MARERIEMFKQSANTVGLSLDFVYQGSQPYLISSWMPFSSLITSAGHGITDAVVHIFQLLIFPHLKNTYIIIIK